MRYQKVGAIHARYLLSYINYQNGRHGTDPWPSKSIIMPFADANLYNILQTCMLLFTVTTVTTVTVVTDVTTV